MSINNNEIGFQGVTPESLDSGAAVGPKADLEARRASNLGNQRRSENGPINEACVSDDLLKCGDMISVQDSGITLGCAIREILSPVMETMAKFMQNNTEALERLAAAQKVQSDRMEALERQIRLNTLVTPTQVRYFNDAIREHARELLSKKELDGDAKAVKSLSASIRRSIVSRYGIAALHEVPKHEYSVVMNQIDTWNDMLLVRDVMKEARSRRDENTNDA